MAEENEKYWLQAKYLKEKGLSATEVIPILRASGASQMTTVRALVNEFEMALPDADHAVLFSSTWADQLEGTLELRELAADVMDNYEFLADEFADS